MLSRFLATLGLAMLASIGLLASDSDRPIPKFADAKASRAEYDRIVAPFFAKHCNGCHGPRKAEGDLALEKLDPDMKASPSAARWAMLLEKLATGEMPPESKPRPEVDSIRAVVAWINAEMKRSNKHSARRAAYANGNSVAHGLLFDPKQSAPLDSPSRIRRLSPEIYKGLIGDISRRSDISQPFSPEGKTTFKDMGAPKIDEPVSAQLMRNAISIVDTLSSQREFKPLFDAKTPPSDAQIDTAIAKQFELILRRAPTAAEKTKFATFMRKNIKEAGIPVGPRYALAAVLLLPEAVFRMEVGTGKVDDKGRLRLAPREIAYAIAYALTDRRPDAALLAAAAKGDLDTDAGVAKVVRKMLDDEKLEKPRILRFFREYFNYEHALEIFKDMRLHNDHDARVLVEDTDKLVQWIVAQDKQVLKELLTTNKSFVAYKTAETTKKNRAKALAQYEERKAKEPEKFKNKMPPKQGRSIYEAYGLKDFPDKQPTELPASERAGILTQPAWLVAHSTSDDNHAIHRGKWIRERLLGGVVPDIPITVDAQLPDAPHKTLRERMAITQDSYCWKCHRLMNDVGLPFEMYDHLGRNRKTEPVRDLEATKKNVDRKGIPLGPVLKMVPVDTKGAIRFSGDAKLDGDVKDAIALIRKLADSELVEQVFIRHTFRYWMGRNETLGDARSLQATLKAYRESNGSLKALITALVSSESFLYCVPTPKAGE